MTQDDLGAFNRAMARRWHLYRPPARPSPGDVSLYTTAMVQAKETLLLGSTPEIRTLGRRYGHRLTAVDRNVAVYGALESLVDGDPSKEKFVKSNWLQMEMSTRFDLAVGDGSLNMLPPELHESFLGRLAAHVRPGGHVLLRAYMVTEPTFSNPKAVFERARELGGDLYTAVKIHLSQLWLDQISGAMPNAIFWQALKRLRQEGVTTAVELDNLGTILAEDTLTVYFVRRERLEKLAAPYFDVVNVCGPGDYEASEQKPIFTLRRR